jgi:hypothetical protein
MGDMIANYTANLVMGILGVSIFKLALRGSALAK